MKIFIEFQITPWLGSEYFFEFQIDDDKVRRATLGTDADNKHAFSTQVLQPRMKFLSRSLGTLL